MYAYVYIYIYLSMITLMHVGLPKSMGPMKSNLPLVGDLPMEPPRIGCVRIQFFKNWDKIVTMVSEVQGGTTMGGN